jgi:hypothetical protein
MLSKLLSLVHGGKKEEPEAAEKTEMPKPTREEIMNVFRKFKMTAFNEIDVSPKDENTVAYLKSLGLVTVVEQHFLNEATGKIECRKTAKWNSWDCSWCANFYYGDMTTEWGLLGNKTTYRNIALCKKGYDLQFRDFMKGKRCPHFLPKQLVEVVGDV